MGCIAAMLVFLRLAAMCPLWLRVVIDLFCRQMKTIRTLAGCVFGLAKDRRGT
jgi:hypothetical protein